MSKFSERKLYGDLFQAIYELEKSQYFMISAKRITAGSKPVY